MIDDEPPTLFDPPPAAERPSNTSTLREARRWVMQERHEPEGVTCPVCDQYAKVYKRQVTSTSARALIAMWRAAGYEYVNMPELLQRKQADEAKMAYWGLIEEMQERRPDGGRAGWWRVTSAGRRWLLDITGIPKYALVYNGHFLGFDGPQISIRDALGQKFDYNELMHG